MSRIVAAERAVYEEIFAGVPEYTHYSPGEERLPLFLDMARPEAGATVLDAGCGGGKGAVALKAAGFQVAMCDLTDEGLSPEGRAAGPFFQRSLWDDLGALPYLVAIQAAIDDKAEDWEDQASRGRRVSEGRASRMGWDKFDYVYCCDVLEHIPPEFTMLVVARLLAVARLGVFLSIAHAPDQFGAWVGRPLHLTVEPHTWWRDRLAELGEVVECRDLLGSGVYFLRNRG